MKTTLLSLAEWEVLFSERSFNPPHEQSAESEAAFSNEFQDAFDAVDSFLASEFAEMRGAESAPYHLHEYWNWSRVLSVEFVTHQFLEQRFVARLQAILSNLPNEWTVICHFVATTFVSPHEVKVHLIDGDFYDDVEIGWLGRV